MNIYVGNIAWKITEEDLEAAFSEYGTVVSAKIITDKETGKSKGFGFVEMASEEEGTAAIEALNGAELEGRGLKVNVARPKPEKSSRR